MQYLKAVQVLKTLDSDKVMAYLKSTPLNDFYAQGTIRPDGRYLHNIYLMHAKPPGESKQPWDYVKRIATVSGSEAFGTKAESKCPLWK